MLPLPKEVRRAAERSVQKFGTDKSVQSPAGFIVERPK